MVDDFEGILSVILFDVQLPPDEIIFTNVVKVFWGDFLKLVHLKKKNYSSLAYIFL